MKKILITGASKGIGLATARLLVDQGNKITGLARGFDGINDDFEQICLDLSKIDELPKALSNEALFGQDFDCLVLNAGYGQFGGLEQFSHQQIRQLIDTNLISNLFLIKHFLPQFKSQGNKDIVLIGSESALHGGKQGTVYCASKFALRGLAQSLRADCCTSDIRVILINPGAVDSDFFDDLSFTPEIGDSYAIQPEAVATAISHALEQPRNVVTEEINLQPIKRAFRKRS